MAGLITALDDLAAISEVGGKGINLARLTRAGFRVPDGRIIGTDAYRRFVGAGLQDRVVDRVAGLEATDLDGLEVASDEIRGWFTATQLPAELRQAILDGCAPLLTARLGVRSSATTEDPPDLSFAGQQDTVLGVDGAEHCAPTTIENRSCNSGSPILTSSRHAPPTTLTPTGVPRATPGWW